MTPSMHGHRQFTPSALDRAARTFMTAGGALPTPLARLLGGTPTVVDGQTLDPHLQFGLRALSLIASEELEDLDLAAARADTERQSFICGGTPVDLPSVRDVRIPVADAEIDGRLYSPTSSDDDLPLVVYFHGGGWVVGSIDSHDTTCRYIAHEAEARVLSVDYRLAPDFRFPTAADDAVAAFRWARDNAGDLHVDPDRIAVAGDSAGGNLAAVVCQQVRDAGETGPAFQLLFVPAVDMSSRTRSYELFGHGFYLTTETMDFYEESYIRSDADRTDPKASPLLAEDFRGLPPAHVAVAGFDPLRDEGEHYARKLAGAGVTVSLRRHAGSLHPFVNTLGPSALGRRAVSEAVGALRMGLAY